MHLFSFAFSKREELKGSNCPKPTVDSRELTGTKPVEVVSLETRPTGTKQSHGPKPVEGTKAVQVRPKPVKSM